jgi:exonuclease III
MANVPSTRRSRAIRNMCDNLGITDPYRIFYPDTREYTFTPSGLNQLNRSRLDFFLVSKNLCEKLVNVVIPHSLSSTIFDHKNVNLIFAKKRVALNSL